MCVCVCLELRRRHKKSNHLLSSQSVSQSVCQCVCLTHSLTHLNSVVVHALWETRRIQGSHQAAVQSRVFVVSNGGLVDRGHKGGADAVEVAAVGLGVCVCVCLC